MDVDTPAAAPTAAATGGDEISPAPAAAAAKSKAVAAPTGRKAFEVKRYAAVAMWSWDVVVQSCAICRNHIMQHCIECQANASSTTMAECNVATGMCNHAFHTHCISRWLKTRQVCPLDNSAWEYASFTR